MPTKTVLTYTVPDMSCAHCKTALTEALGTVPGVRDVAVDLETKQIVVHGEGVADAAARAAIADAGYEAA